MKERSSIRDLKADFFRGLGVPQQEAFVVDPFQQEAISAVMEGLDTLVVAPTGSGKTFIAIEAMRGHLQLRGRCVYTTPLKALSNTKFNELKGRFEPEYRVGLLTGDRKIQVDANLVVATTEIYRNELYQASDRYSLVVLDEVHFIADPQRGPVWEESIILTPSSSTLLMLSASISNVQEVADWIQSVRGKPCKIVVKKDRPVELRYGFMHPDLGIIPLQDSAGHVLPEVRQFYANTRLDASGMRLQGRGQGRGRGNSGGYRGRRGRRR